MVVLVRVKLQHQHHVLKRTVRVICPFPINYMFIVLTISQKQILKLRQKYCIQTVTRYDKFDDAGGCCISSNQWHQNCNCGGPITNCKALCDKDLNCKGYVDRKDGKCNIATTSDCPAIDCAGPYSIGNVGKLKKTCTTSESSTGGCYIKLGNITLLE